MAVLARKHSIPTVAVAVERFLASRQRQSWHEHASVLSGPPSGRVVGRAAAGTTLARSELGALRFDRVTPDQFVTWLHARHPAQLSRASFKRGRSSLRQLLLYAIANGWTDERVLQLLPPAPAAPPRRDWLRPEQVVAIDPLVTTKNGFSDEQCFQWRTALNTGVRVEELVTLQPSALNATDNMVTVIGKGQKLRHIPVGPDFAREWVEYVLRHGLSPRSWMFPLSGIRFTAAGAVHRETERVVLDASRHCDQKAFRAMVARVQELAQDRAREGKLDAALLPSFTLVPHTLRRTYATSNLIAAALLGSGMGLDLRSLQDAMGHASLETTALYLGDVSAYLSRYRRPISTVAAAQHVLELPSAA